MSIKVNNSAGWKTDSHDPSILKLMDNGKERASIKIPNSFKVSDITDKMYELNKETTWGEKSGMSKQDYEDVFKIYLGMK